MQDESNERDKQIAWAAGLFEGEGCFGAYRRKGRGGKVNVVARLAMTDADVVRRFAAIVGFGTIRPDVVRKNKQPLTEWYTQRRANVRELITMFMPYLGDRRRARAQEILDLGEALPKNERTHCPEGHPYSGDNLVLEPIRGGKYFARRCKACRTIQARERARVRNGTLEENYRK